MSILQRYLQNEKYEVKTVHVRDLPAEDLLYANFSSPAIQEAQKKVADADAVIIVSPIYKASYTGILKTFLDLIPEKGLHNKTVSADSYRGNHCSSTSS